MNRAVRLLALVTAGLLATAANATVSLQFSKIGFTEANAATGFGYKVGFNGVSDGAGKTMQFDNIGGEVTYRLVNVDHVEGKSGFTSSWHFVATIKNTSLPDMKSARISAVGFSTAGEKTDGDNPAFLALSGASITGKPEIYDILAFNNRGLRLPNVSGSNDPQVCLKASGPTNNCAGGGGDGLEMGSGFNLGSKDNPFPSTSSEFILSFTGPEKRTAITLHNLILRFQSLSGTGVSGANSGKLDGDSGVGIVTSVDIVPEPTSWAMLITGFGLIGAAARRRRTVVA